MTVTPFGTRLREWRSLRGWSQLDLAARAGVSQRHLSFLETGRSHPRRATVLRLGEVLDVAPREQNLLLSSAGYGPEFGETTLDDLGHLTGVLDNILAAHEPHMALVVDRRWDVVRSNGPATAFAATLFPTPPSWLRPPLNLMRLSLHPEGLRPHMVGWQESARALVGRLQRDVRRHPHDAGLRALWEEVRAYPDVAGLEAGSPRIPQGGPQPGTDLLLTTTYVVGDERIALLSTVMTIGDAHDLTLSELRLETFWPADPTSQQRWLDHFG